MKETINYYYNLNPNRINKIFDYYYFYVNNELYYFMIYKRKLEDINAIYDFNRSMISSNILVNEIINNRDNSIVTYVNKIPYILIKIYVNINKAISLGEISYLSNAKIFYQNNLMRSNWALLWSNKIDYLEYHHGHNYQKYPLLSLSFDYFIGLSENAIYYLNNAIKNTSPEDVDIGVISHDIINSDDTIYALYDQ